MSLSTVSGQIQMLNQRPAADDVEHLMTAADGERRLAEVEGSPHRGELDCIMGDVDAI
jgi:hypothetical protein